MVKRMAAERLSRRLIRLMPPNSVFIKASDFPQMEHCPPEDAMNLASSELPWLRFVPPDLIARQLVRRAEAILTVSEYVWG